jgi:hypothetical protein
MGILDDLLGGGRQRQEYSDFVSRYDQGHPSEGYSDQEVMARYGEVAHKVPRDQYAEAAQEALARMSPEERAGFAKMLQQRAQAQGVQLPGQVTASPHDLGQVLTDLHQKPGQLRDLLGTGSGALASAAESGAGGMAGMLSSPLAKAALAGIAAIVVKRAMGR